MMLSTGATADNGAAREASPGPPVAIDTDGPAPRARRDAGPSLTLGTSRPSREAPGSTRASPGRLHLMLNRRAGPGTPSPPGSGVRRRRAGGAEGDRRALPARQR